MAIKISSGNYYDSRSFLKDTDFRNFYLDTTRFPKFNRNRGVLVQVPAQCENRIDLFSYQQYGSSRLWWVIALANADIIRDPIWDFKSGMVVFVPRDADIIEKMPGAE
jgi:hypothetical protein